jgi:pimeloyl-ACP methyl ester carboxylesterase
MNAAAMTAPHPARTARAPNGLLTLVEGRALFELGAFYALRPLLGGLPRGDGHPVLVLPGFMASDTSTLPMRRLLRELGYDVHGWELGRNIKVDHDRVSAMRDLLTRLFKDSGRKVSIVGWSLGGVFARELAKMHPEAVRQVISLGSPISDDRNHSNARIIFEWLNGRQHRPERAGHRFAELGIAPPVPTTSILTRSDGVVHWRGSVQHGELAGHDAIENIEVFASHYGLGVNPSVMVAIADRLAQAEGAWKPFRPALRQRWMFPRGPLH